MIIFSFNNTKDTVIYEQNISQGSPFLDKYILQPCVGKWCSITANRELGARKAVALW